MGEHFTSRSLPRLAGAIAIVVFGILLVFRGISGIVANSQSLKAPNGRVQIEVLTTPEQRQQGLSGRDSLAEDMGILFVFDESSDKNCFWMKDMKFSIDMVWINDSKEVVTVHKNVDPESYPESFCPESPARYGLELTSMKSQKLGIELGSKLQFKY